MREDEWFDLCSELIDGTVRSIQNDTNKVTEADIGLVLSIAGDYLDNPEENLSRDIRALEFTQAILDAKYNIEDLSWFDLYESVVELNSKVGRRVENVNNSGLDYQLEDLYNQKKAGSSHTREFQEVANRLFEAISSKKAEKLQKSDPYDDLDADDFDNFRQAVRTKSGFRYGNVEIPNNASRMRAASKFTEYTKDLGDDDLRWMITTLREWIQMYARAESKIADRNLEQSELREFMIEGETPAERYWGQVTHE
jgi:hypothetical protein